MRKLVLVAALAFTLAGCGHHAESTEDVAAPVADVAPASPSPSAAAPAVTHHSSPERAAWPGPAHRAARPAAPVRTAYPEWNAGSGDAKLDAFVAAVRDRLPIVAADRRDEEIEDIGRQICAARAARKPTGTVVAYARTLGTPDPDATDQASASELVRLADGTLC